MTARDWLAVGFLTASLAFVAWTFDHLGDESDCRHTVPSHLECP